MHAQKVQATKNGHNYKTVARARMGGGASTLPATINKATARELASRAGAAFDEATFDAAAFDGSVTRDEFLTMAAVGGGGGASTSPSALTISAAHNPTSKASEERLRNIACADLFLDKLEMASTLEPADEVVSRYAGMLKSGMLEIEEENDDDDDDVVIREISLPSTPAIRLLLEGAVDRVRKAAASGLRADTALGPLRDELLLACSLDSAPATTATKALVLSELAAASMQDTDALALRNAYGELIARDEKRTLVHRSAEAGMSADGQTSIMDAWVSDGEGVKAGATKLMDGIAGLSASDQKVVNAVVDGAAYEAVIAEELVDGSGVSGAAPNSVGTRGRGAKHSLLQRAIKQGASLDAVQAIASRLIQVTSSGDATPTGSVAGGDGTPGKSGSSTDAASSGTKVSDDAQLAAEGAAALAQKLKGVTVSKDLREARVGAAKQAEEAAKLAEKWRAVTQQKKSELQGQNAELKKKLANVKSRLFS